MPTTSDADRTTEMGKTPPFDAPIMSNGDKSPHSTPDSGTELTSLASNGVEGHGEVDIAKNVHSSSKSELQDAGYRSVANADNNGEFDACEAAEDSKLSHETTCMPLQEKKENFSSNAPTIYESTSPLQETGETFAASSNAPTTDESILPLKENRETFAAYSYVPSLDASPLPLENMVNTTADTHADMCTDKSPPPPPPPLLQNMGNSTIHSNASTIDQCSLPPLDNLGNSARNAHTINDGTLPPQGSIMEESADHIATPSIDESTLPLQESFAAYSDAATTNGSTLPLQEGMENASACSNATAIDDERTLPLEEDMENVAAFRNIDPTIDESTLPLQNKSDCNSSADQLRRRFEECLTGSMERLMKQQGSPDRVVEETMPWMQMNDSGFKKAGEDSEGQQLEKMISAESDSESWTMTSSTSSREDRTTEHAGDSVMGKTPPFDAPIMSNGDKSPHSTPDSGTELTSLASNGVEGHGEVDIAKNVHSSSTYDNNWKCELQDARYRSVAYADNNGEFDACEAAEFINIFDSKLSHEATLPLQEKKENLVAGSNAPTIDESTSPLQETGENFAASSNAPTTDESILPLKENRETFSVCSYVPSLDDSPLPRENTGNTTADTHADMCTDKSTPPPPLLQNMGNSTIYSNAATIDLCSLPPPENIENSARNAHTINEGTLPPQGSIMEESADHITNPSIDESPLQEKMESFAAYSDAATTNGSTLPLQEGMENTSACSNATAIDERTLPLEEDMENVAAFRNIDPTIDESTLPLQNKSDRNSSADQLRRSFEERLTGSMERLMKQQGSPDRVVEETMPWMQMNEKAGEDSEGQQLEKVISAESDVRDPKLGHETIQTVVEDLRVENETLLSDVNLERDFVDREGQFIVGGPGHISALGEYKSQGDSETSYKLNFNLQEENLISEERLQSSRVVHEGTADSFGMHPHSPERQVLASSEDHEKPMEAASFMACQTVDMKLDEKSQEMKYPLIVEGLLQEKIRKPCWEASEVVDATSTHPLQVDDANVHNLSVAPQMATDNAIQMRERVGADPHMNVSHSCEQDFLKDHGARTLNDLGALNGHPPYVAAVEESEHVLNQPAATLHDPYVDRWEVDTDVVEPKGKRSYVRKLAHGCLSCCRQPHVNS